MNSGAPANRPDLSDEVYKTGQGNWRAFGLTGFSLPRVIERTEVWKQALKGIEKPWLCWNVDSDWCLVQQKLARHVGWTPVIGFDPRVGAPDKLVPDAVVVDFNDGLGLPVLYPHFAMEFAFLFCDRLAFWHSDLLVRTPLLEQIAAQFDAMEDGETFVTEDNQGWSRALFKRYRRYWELIGCTTKAASKDQFEQGCGWWMNFFAHPNCPNERERKLREKYFWDHGAGIYYWRHKCGGRVKVIEGRDIHEGHCTKIGNSKYRRTIPVNTSDAQRSMSSELSQNFDIVEVCRGLGLDSFLP